LGEGRKRFFFEKKKQKTFDCFRPRRWNACARCADLEIVSNIAAKTGHARLYPGAAINVWQAGLSSEPIGKTGVDGRFRGRHGHTERLSSPRIIKQKFFGYFFSKK
jgi:hypothetical protein